jgi:hypothetical protein
MRLATSLLLGVAIGFVTAGPVAAASRLVLDPAQPHVAQPVAFSWAGRGDDVSVAVSCSDGTYAEGRLKDEDLATPLVVTFGQATDCQASTTAISYSGRSQGYQYRVYRSSFVVLP